MNDIIICDKGRVTFSDSEEWHLQDDDWFFEMASKTAAEWREICTSELKKLCEEHYWIDVWSITGDLSSDDRELRVGQWRIVRADDKDEDGNIVRQLVFFSHFEDDFVRDMPMYKRSDDDILVKITPGMEEYDDRFNVDEDEGWLFYLKDVPRIWDDLRRRRLMSDATNKLSPFERDLNWQGRMVRSIRRLIDEGRYEDAVQTTACAAARFERDFCPGDNLFNVAYKQMLKVLAMNELYPLTDRISKER